MRARKQIFSSKSTDRLDLRLQRVLTRYVMIYIKTERGRTALQSRSSILAARHRAAFIMFDGKRSDEDVLQATSGFGFTMVDVEQMLGLGLIEVALDQTGGRSDSSLSQYPNSSVLPSQSASSPLSAAWPASMPAGSQGVTLPPAGTPSLDAQAHFLKAWPIATRLTANLGLRGFRLNLAVESAGDLVKLKELAPRIKDAVGSEKFRELEVALYQ